MALAFFGSPEEPVRCAMQNREGIARAAAVSVAQGNSQRPVDRVTDVNDARNVAGAGINMAQRVMDCGDSAHILLSKRIADDLAQYGRWRARLHDLGEPEVKHGITIGVVSLHGDDFGNPAIPADFARRREREEIASRGEQSRFRKRRRFLIAAALFATGLLISLAIFGYTTARKLNTTAAAGGVGLAIGGQFRRVTLENRASSGSPNNRVDLICSFGEPHP